MTDHALQSRTIDVIRGLAMDAPQKANSGHPGTAMALAPLAYTLWTRVMRYDASAPHWPNRDRFVLSNGHASILQYSMLYLTGYGLTLDDIEDFRQWSSATPGHPEVHHTEGIEVTTGPLGQGVANAVGLALAEHWLRARFGPQLFDHHTFAFCGDGDLEEGLSHEACLAGRPPGPGQARARLRRQPHLDRRPHRAGAQRRRPSPLRRPTDGTSRTSARSARTSTPSEAALRRAMDVDDRPSMVVLRSHIGYPSPKFTDTAAAHGSPLGAEEISATKTLMGMPDEPFWVPDDVLEHMREAGRRGRDARLEWEQVHDGWTEDRAELDAALGATGLPGWQDALPSWEVGEKVATRNAGKKVLNALLPVVPGLVGGGADLTGNTGVEITDGAAFSVSDRGGRQIHFGIREHAMGGIMNGMAAHGGMIPFGGTFFVFSDYMRPSVRLAALSELKVVYSWTHDSVGLGEDGPTHQPIEHLASLRAMPNLRVIRPADANETASAWRLAIERGGPTALVLSRQNLPVLDGTDRLRRPRPGRLRPGGTPMRRPTSSSSAPAPRSSSVSPPPSSWPPRA